MLQARLGAVSNVAEIASNGVRALKEVETVAACRDEKERRRKAIKAGKRCVICVTTIATHQSCSLCPALRPESQAGVPDGPP